MSKVVILGAGLTGLSTAYNFEKSGFFNFKIFEKNNTSGGLLRSVKKDGFTFDFTGHLLHINNPDFYNFLNEVAGLENFFSQERKSFIYTHQRLIKYPFQANLYNLPLKVKFECIKGYIKRKKELRKVESFHDWVLKYFGYGIGKHFFFPYNSKLLDFDLKKITPTWTGRFVPKIDLKTLIKSSLNLNKNQKLGYNSSFYYPQKNGIQFLIDSLMQKIKSKIYTNHQAIEVNLKEKKIIFKNGHVEKFDFLITTIPLKELIKNLKEKSNNNLKITSKKLKCNSVINLNLGFNINKIKDKHWIYYPENKYPFYRIGFWNNISSSSTPKNYSSIYIEQSFLPQKYKEYNLEKNISNAVNHSIKTLQLQKKNLILKKTLYLPYAYVIYDSWREKNLKILHKNLEQNCIFSVGRYGEWKYSSMEEAFFDGKNIVNKILPLLHYPNLIKKHPHKSI